MHTILLTSGRAAFSLALARTLNDAGHRVLVADSWPRTVCRYSTAVERYFRVPAAATATSEWVDAILGIVDECAVDLIVPVFEEVFHLAHALDSLPKPPPLFASDFDTLHTIHNKWLFNKQAKALGLPVPHTDLLTRRGDVLTAFSQGDGKNKVFKAVYTRFATNTIVRPSSIQALDHVEPTEAKPWLVQEHLPGRPVCTFTVAHNGRITAHAAYSSDLSLGFGPSAAYRRLEHPAAFEWVQTFIKSLRYTGQLGIDFIEDRQGNIAAIEGNPRMTGGMFLLKDEPGFISAYLDPESGPIFPTSDRAYTFRVPLLLTCLLRRPHFPGFREWAKVFFRGKGINPFLLSDPLPAVMAPIIQHSFVVQCLRQGKNVRASATEDFEWSELPKPAPLKERELPKSIGLTEVIT